MGLTAPLQMWLRGRQSGSNAARELEPAKIWACAAVLETPGALRLVGADVQTGMCLMRMQADGVYKGREKARECRRARRQGKAQEGEAGTLALER